MKPDANQHGKSPNAPPTDQSGATVNVVKRDIEDKDDDTRGVDEVITPTSTRSKEQDAETIKDRAAEVERKLNQP